MTLSLFEPNRLPLTSGETWRVDESDCVTWLKAFGAETVDLIVTDPPYESLDKHRAKGTTPRLVRWFETVRNAYFPHFFDQAYRVLKPNTHLYVMCDQETMFAIKPMGEAAGFTFHKPIVWDKLKMGLGYHYRARCEFILFFEKGKRRLNSLGITDVLEEEAPDILKVSRVSGGQFSGDWRKRRAETGEVYPTEKPVGLLSTLISQSSSEGDIVVDPFCGSGSTGEAALRLGRRFAGCDLSQEAIDMTGPRLLAVSAELEGLT